LFVGSHPILMHLMENLPAGPKALIVNHRKDEVMAITRAPVPSIASNRCSTAPAVPFLPPSAFVNAQRISHVIITMGDVPFVQKTDLRNRWSTVSDPRSDDS
jgi:bifunctional UDP-N-acetylglucosamine pyrophosphorylase/glucosamine-1-phosphate N-acetyltransferase